MKTEIKLYKLKRKILKKQEYEQLNQISQLLLAMKKENQNLFFDFSITAIDKSYQERKTMFYFSWISKIPSQNFVNPVLSSYLCYAVNSLRKKIIQTAIKEIKKDLKEYNNLC